MIHGYFHSIGENIPHERIAQSLRRIDQIGRVFRRHVIERKAYSVPGPNALWHHDGQHGMSFARMLLSVKLSVIV